MIKPGQIYRACNPRESIRIRVTAYRPGDARAHVVDAVTGKRSRQILVKDLHDSPVTATGRRRRSGYVLDRDVTNAPQEAAEGPQERPEGSSGGAEALEGQNGPQTGAGSREGGQQPRGPVDWARQQAAEREQQPIVVDLQAQIAAAIHDTPARYPDDIATAVWRVVDREIERMKIRVAASESDGHAVRMAAQYAEKAIENGERAGRADATLARVRTIAAELFVAGRTETDRATGRRLLNALAEPAHDTGPSVREAAAADRRWPLEKAGE